MNSILIAVFVITALFITGIFPEASSFMGYHERYLHCPYPSGTTTYNNDYYVTITSESSLQSCKQTNSCYNPGVLVVDCYSNITWHNDDSNMHLISSGSEDNGPDGWFASQAIYPGSEFSFFFERPGIYTYYDPLHSWAQGTIIVKSGNSNIDSQWLSFVRGPNCTLGEPNCIHPSLR